eukprot:gene50635-biopygen41420
MHIALAAHRFEAGEFCERIGMVIHPDIDQGIFLAIM